MICARCGAPLAARAVACSYCGVGIAGPAPATTGAGEVAPEVIALLRRRDKIGAIKAHRARFGTSLLDAKNAVEALERELGLR